MIRILCIAKVIGLHALILNDKRNILIIQINKVITNNTEV